jgi:hypothetical protein
MLARDATNPPDALQAHILGTYFTLRWGIVVLSAALPLILYIGGHFFGHFPLEPSLSAYYGSHDGFMRNWFVGILWAVGAFLFLYKGYSTMEEIFLDVAGAGAILTAMFPCHCEGGGTNSRAHVFFAVTFFACMMVVCLRFAHDTLETVPDKMHRTMFRQAYRILGVVMFVAPALAILFGYRDSHKTFYIEVLGIWSFAAYWITKSIEISITKSEKHALQKETTRVPGRGVVRTDQMAGESFS